MEAGAALMAVSTSDRPAVRLPGFEIDVQESAPEAYVRGPLGIKGAS